MIDVALLLDRLSIGYQRRGAYLTARCPHPDHPDKNPSWAIRSEPGSTRHGQHRCMSCGWWGGPVSLIAAVARCTGDEARAFLANIESLGPGLPLAVEVVIQEPLRSGEARLPDGVWFEPMHLWPPLARDYLTRRCVTEEQVKRWGMGYSVEGELAGRVVFVLRNEGRVVGWTARSFKNKEPRYKEPRRGVPGVVPGAIFGEEHWPSLPARRREPLIVVEGPFDGLAAESVGCRFAALRGSHLHPDQARRLATWPRLIVVTDPDAAGDSASFQVSGSSRWQEVVRVSPPKGDDCSSLFERDREALRSLLWRAA